LRSQKKNNNSYKPFFDYLLMLLNVEPPEYSVYFQKPLSSPKVVESLLEHLVLSLGHDIHVSRQKNMLLTKRKGNTSKLPILKRIFSAPESRVSIEYPYETIQGYFTVLEEKPAITVSYAIPYTMGYREMGLKFVGARNEKTKIKIFKEIDTQAKKFISKNV